MKRWPKLSSLGLRNSLPKGEIFIGMASVASFFVSRIDTLIDSIVEQELNKAANPAEQVLLQGILAKITVANARLTYQK
jgi:transaldolase